MQKIKTNRKPMPNVVRKLETIKTIPYSAKTKEKVTSELLKIGLSFNYIGTHYLMDAIGIAVESQLAGKTTVRAFMGFVTEQVGERYSVDRTTVCTQMTFAINRAFDYGNVNYLLEILKGTYDYDKQKVSYSAFIMNLAERIKIDIEKEYQGTQQMKEMIHEGIDCITNPALLNGIYNIVMSLKGGASV